MEYFSASAGQPAPASRPVRTACSFFWRPLALLVLLGLALLPLGIRAQAPVWSAAAIGSTTQNSGTTQTMGIATDGSGNVYVTGLFTGTVAFGSTTLATAGSQDLFVAKWVPATNTWAWAQRAGGSSTDQGLGIAVNTVSGVTSVYVTGFITNNTSNASAVRFGGTVQQNGATASNSIDLVVAKYTDNGSSASFNWSQVGGGINTDQGQGVAVTTVSGVTSVYVTGYITNTTTDGNCRALRRLGHCRWYRPAVRGQYGQYQRPGGG
jgi:hypothetical protein